MLRVALTGGIGSGKSTVSARLAALGAFVVDADAVAREVVEPGTPALAAVVERFGPEVVTADGTLDRPALGRLVFGDRAALRRPRGDHPPGDLGAHRPRSSRRPGPDAVVVHDMPLVVEKAMGAQYHLVVVVGRGRRCALRRLVELRGMPEADARARIAAQADDEARRAAADVWLDNEGDAGRAARRRDAALVRAARAVRGQRAARHPVPPLAPDDVGARRRRGRRRPRGCSPGCGTPWATRP